MRMISYPAIALVAGLTLSHNPVGAQVLTIGTTNPGGLVNTLGTTVAKVLVDKAGMKVVVVPQGGATMPAVTAREIECGVTNIFDLSFYVTASAYYQGDPKHENLRLVAALLPARVAAYVRKSSDIHTVADLRGKRVPSGYNAQPPILKVMEAYLANGGLSYDDVQPVPAQTIVRGADDFAAGKNDTFIYSVGTAKVLEVQSSVRGGMRAVGLEDTPEKLAKLQAKLPGAYFRTVKPASNIPYVEGPTTVMSYDLVLACHDQVPDDVVYKMTKAIHDNKPQMMQITKAMRLFEPDRMNPKAAGVSYHSGAQRFYAEMGKM